MSSSNRPPLVATSAEADMRTLLIDLQNTKKELQSLAIKSLVEAQARFQAIRGLAQSIENAVDRCEHADLHTLTREFAQLGLEVTAIIKNIQTGRFEVTAALDKIKPEEPTYPLEEMNQVSKIIYYKNEILMHKFQYHCADFSPEDKTEALKTIAIMQHLNQVIPETWKKFRELLNSTSPKELYAKEKRFVKHFADSFSDTLITAYAITTSKQPNTSIFTTPTRIIDALANPFANVPNAPIKKRARSHSFSEAGAASAPPSRPCCRRLFQDNKKMHLDENKLSQSSNSANSDSVSSITPSASPQFNLPAQSQDTQTPPTAPPSPKL